MADSIRAPLVKWAGGLLSRNGALTGDRNCCCCVPLFCVRYYEYWFTGIPTIGPDPFPPFSSYYDGPGLNTCVFELAQNVENCTSTAGERLFKIWIGSCCPLDNYNNDENVFFANEIDGRMNDYWQGVLQASGEARQSLIYCLVCGELTHDTWPPSPAVTSGGVDLPNPYPPFGEPCTDGFWEMSSYKTCEDLKRTRKCCEGFSTGF